MNKLIKESLTKLKQKNIINPELDLRILLKHASKKKNKIIFINFNLNNIIIFKFNFYLQKKINKQQITKLIKNNTF